MVSGMYLRAIFTLFFLALQSCAQQPQSASTITEPPVAPKLPAPLASPKKTLAQPQVIILVSENIPAYSNVAKALAKQLGKRGSIYNLSANSLENLKTIAKFKNEEHTQFVSIGLNASLAAKNLGNRQVVFCQVFNYQDYALLTPRHKGISMLPSLAKLFSTWRAMAPDIRHIGVVSGPGFDEVIALARETANTYAITLHHQTVNSDKEYQYAYKKMGKEVQGYWVLPDNRVLSENILRDIMNFSVRNSKQVAVFSAELLNLGGLFSYSADFNDVANQVIERLEQSQTSDVMPGPDIVYPDKLNLFINPVMANNLSLKIPPQLRKSIHAP